MCDPTSITYAVVAVYGAYAAKRQGDAQAIQIQNAAADDAEIHRMNAIHQAHAANTQAETSLYEAGIAAYNARVAENDAEKVREVGVEKENDRRRRTAHLVSKQRTQLAANNVDIGSGSALQLQQDSLDLGEVDALRVKKNYENQAERFEQQEALHRGQSAVFKNRAANFAQQAHFHLAEGDIGSQMINRSGLEQSAAAQSAGRRNATGSLISGATGVSSKWYTSSSAASTGANYGGRANSSFGSSGWAGTGGI